MRPCTHCGKRLPKRQAICPHCGRNVPFVVPTPNPRNEQGLRAWWRRQRRRRRSS